MGDQVKGEEVERGGLRHGGGQFSEAEGDGDDEEAGDKPAEDPADVAACAKISFPFKGGEREISVPLTRPKDRVEETEATTPMMEKAKATVSMSCERR